MDVLNWVELVRVGLSWFELLPSDPSVIMLPDCSAAEAAPAILPSFGIRSFFCEKWLLPHEGAGPRLRAPFVRARGARKSLTLHDYIFSGAENPSRRMHVSSTSLVSASSAIHPSRRAVSSSLKIFVS